MEYPISYELEKTIIGVYFTKDYLINESRLSPKHFLNTENRNVFIYLQNFYKENKNLDITLMINKIPSQSSKAKMIEYFTSSTELVLTTVRIKEYEEELIVMWQKHETTLITKKFVEGEIDFKELKIRLDEINQNQYFKNLLDVGVDVSDTKPNTLVEREYTNIRQLDYLLKGIEYGKLTLWSSVTNGGKTTLMTQLARENLKAKKKVFYFNGEHTAEEFKNNLYITMCNKSQLLFVKDLVNENIVDVMPNEEMNRYLNNILQDKLFIYNNDIPKNDIKTMISVMEEAFRKGVRIFYIDNFMQLDDSEQLDQQTRIIEQFKRFARDNHVIVNLVAHPRKTQFSCNRLGINDISGTQNIANKSANICTIIRTDTMSDAEKDSLRSIVLRNGYLIENCDSIIEVVKTKGTANGMVGLSYDKDTKTYKEVRKVTQEEFERMDIESYGKPKRRAR